MTGQVVPEAGRAWLRRAAPDRLAGFRFSAYGSWPIEAGAVCDLVSVPSSLGLEMIECAEGLTDHRLGPAYGGAELVTFLVRVGVAIRLRNVLVLTLGVSGGRCSISERV